MLFNSLSFVVFFPIVALLYFGLPQRFRWIHLLAASCVFYASFIPAYLLVLAFLIVVDYLAGLLIERSTGTTRKTWLGLSIVANLLTLAVFKYYDFGAENLNAVLTALGLSLSFPLLSLVLPVGLSFHTFQAMSYTIEVFRGRQPAERHLGIYALYVMFFPQLVAGPIERPQHLLGQFREKHDFDYQRVTSGLKLMSWGLFKKAVIADRAGLIVDPVFATPGLFSGSEIVVATILYAYQIYCDFSGYSDIAVGAARVIGFDLMENFRQPYLARSIAEFWQRWHISLSTWFRDYLYIPLGGNRVVAWRWCLIILLVFLASGLWHGASWTFVVWGGLHGCYMIASRWTRSWRGRFCSLLGLDANASLFLPIQVLTTFSIVCFAWIFFRAHDLGRALSMINRLFTDWSSFSREKLGLGGEDFAILLIGIILLETGPTLLQSKKIEVYYRKPALRWTGYFAWIYMLMAYGRYGARQFIYFQF